MTAEEYCCTCATSLASIPATYDEKTEKPARHERRLHCCDRAICARCMTDNPRFESYCPFCQVSTTPGPLPQGLRDPPAYSPPTLRRHEHDSTDERGLPPAYFPPVNDTAASSLLSEKSERPAEDVLHFVHPNDSIAGLSLRYGVPADALRRKNGLYTDHLLAGRRTVLIPGEFYKGGVSLSPRPIEGEEEEIRKSKVRRFMVTCKVVEYDVALLYLSQSDYDLNAATQAYKDDEEWERLHPINAGSKGKAKVTPRRKSHGVNGGLSAQV